MFYIPFHLCCFFNCILPDVLMLSLMLIVIPVRVHFIFMLFQPCINIHLTKITQLINDTVSCDFFFFPTQPYTSHPLQWSTCIFLLLSFFSDAFWSQFNSLQMVTGCGWAEGELRRHHRLPMTPPSHLPSAPRNNFQKCFSWLCVFQIREKVKCLLYKNVAFGPAWISFPCFSWKHAVSPPAQLNVRITN